MHIKSDYITVQNTLSLNNVDNNIPRVSSVYITALNYTAYINFFLNPNILYSSTRHYLNSKF
jgi:hypothetical protein